MNKSDSQLKQDVEAELRWDPRVNSAQIGVTVDNGGVSLMGAVDTYAEKWAAEDATKRVGGVRTLAMDLKVKVLTDHKRDDSEIAGAMSSAFQWNVFVPKTVTAKVIDGMVTLEGKAHWNYQRDAAERAVRYLPGVVSVYNAIAVHPEDASPTDVKQKIEAALIRHATADAKSIHVATSGGKVTLTGNASTWQSIADASSAAWAAPGVTQVLDEVHLAGY